MTLESAKKYQANARFDPYAHNLRKVLCDPITLSRSHKYDNPEYDPDFFNLRSELLRQCIRKRGGWRRVPAELKIVYNGTEKDRERILKLAIEHDKVHPFNMWMVFNQELKKNSHSVWKVYRTLEELIEGEIYGKCIIDIEMNNRAMCRIIYENAVARIFHVSKSGTPLLQEALAEIGDNPRQRDLNRVCYTLLINVGKVYNPGKNFLTEGWNYNREEPKRGRPRKDESRRC